MKKLVLMFVVVIFNTTVVMAENSKPFEDFSKAFKEISNAFNESGLEFYYEGNVSSVKVILTVTTDNELVVLNVNTKDNEIKTYIKKVLNNKIMNSEYLIPGKQYTFLVKLK